MESVLLILAFIVTLGATNLFIYFWNILIMSMTLVINTIMHFSEPVPECIKYEKRMLFGSALQFVFLVGVAWIGYH